MDKKNRYMCTNCRAVMAAYKSSQKDEIIRMYCPWCKSEQTFIKLYKEDKK